MTPEELRNKGKKYNGRIDGKEYFILYGLLYLIEDEQVKAVIN